MAAPKKKPAEETKKLEIVPSGAGARFVIERPEFVTVSVPLIGLSPLMPHAWSAKQRKMMADKQAGIAKTRKREIRDPEQEFRDAAYVLDDGSYAFPAGAFKLAAISACRLIDGITMVAARSLFNVLDEYVVITNPKPEEGREWPAMDDRMVKVGVGVADIRYRPIFWPWACTLRVRFPKGATTVEQLGFLLMLAGETVGVGELRPERGAGNYGRFAIADAENVGVGREFAAR